MFSKAVAEKAKKIKITWTKEEVPEFKSENRMFLSESRSQGARNRIYVHAQC